MKSSGTPYITTSTKLLEFLPLIINLSIALIKKLSQFINFGEEKMLILNIHAGTDNKDIIDWIEIKRVGMKYKVKLEDRKFSKISKTYSH